MNNQLLQIYYRRAAECGDYSSMRVVAFTSNDDAEEFKYYKLSAELLNSGLNKQDSIKQTAINYALGRGTEQDLRYAFNIFHGVRKNFWGDSDLTASPDIT